VLLLSLFVSDLVSVFVSVFAVESDDLDSDFEELELLLLALG
jgi:hypothetical protein